MISGNTFSNAHNAQTSYARARAIFLGLKNGTFQFDNGSGATLNVQQLAAAFASSEFLNNRAFGASASVTQDIANRTVISSQQDKSLNISRPQPGYMQNCNTRAGSCFR